jgi:hypothetical protein
VGLQWIFCGQSPPGFSTHRGFLWVCSGFCGCVEAMGFDLEPIWCHGCGVVGLVWLPEEPTCWRFVSVTVRRIGKVGERKEKNGWRGERK